MCNDLLQPSSSSQRGWLVEKVLVFLASSGMVPHCIRAVNETYLVMVKEVKRADSVTRNNFGER